jgi:hypothetical protein
MTTGKRVIFAALLGCFLLEPVRGRSMTASAPAPAPAGAACSGRPAQVLACEGQATKATVCQPCDGAVLKRCGQKLSPLFQKVAASGGAAINAAAKGKTQKVGNLLTKVQKTLDAITRTADKLIDKIQGAQSCKDAARTAVQAFGSSIVARTGSSTTTTTSPTPTSTTLDVLATANSIVATAGAARTDPEGVAPPAASTSLITWKDSRGANRTMTLGAYLYQYDFSFNDNVQNVSRSANDDAYGHEGFGYVVSHNTQNGNSPLGKANAPTAVVDTVFSGGHHAIHRVETRYDRDKEGGGLGIKIPLVIEWFVATGRDHPIWSVTWKVGEAVNPAATNFDVHRMDVRGPYGSLNFDGAPTRNQGDAIGGVAWGDFGLKFTTTDAQLTLNSPWTYNTPNSVNFTQTWTATTNAEMGIVETRTADKEMGYPDRVYGRERGSTSAGAYLDKRDCSGFGDGRNYVVPCIAGWPYQLMNFDWDPGAGKPANEATGTKLIAWGSPYGWLGASNATLFDYSSTVDARGDRSFATFIVLGPRCRFAAGLCNQPGDVARTIQGVEAFAAATIGNVTTGTVVSEVAKGPGASAMKPIANGYNDTYAAWYLRASGNQVAFTFTPAGGRTVDRPVFVIQNYTGSQLPGVRIGGAPLRVNDGTADSEAFVSVDMVRDELWVTLNRTVSAAIGVQVAP